MKLKLILALLVASLAYPISGYSADPFANLPDPTQHKQKKKKVVKRAKQKALILHSTLIADERSYAIINGKTVAVGERIEGATLLRINPFDVVILKHGQRKTLTLTATDVIRKQRTTIDDD